MNVLVIGGSGSLMDQMMIKLRKEGHRIYLLTGNRYKQEDYGKVFEKYNFTYDSDCMSEIFESVHPDITLFMGAFDTNFSWLDERRDSVRFTSGLINLLSAFSMGDYGRFVYLSSQEVFSGDYPEDITEEEAVTATGFRGMAFAQGEKICKSYQESRKLDIVTLRVDHLYIMPRRRREVDGICSNMCLSALLENKIRANVDHRFSMIYVTDAVEYIYKIMVCKEHYSDLYHISSAEEISELTLAEEIKRAAGREIEIEELEDWNAREVLSKARFNEEFGIQIFHTASEIAGKMMSSMMRNQKEFREDLTRKKPLRERLKERMGWLLQMMIPFLENMVCFIPFFMLNNRAVGSEYFANLDFYLLYVLLFAIIYGQQQATFSAVLAVAGYLFRQMYHRTGFEVMLDYNTYVWIAQLFILGLVVGYMRDQIRIMKSESEEEQEFLTYQLNDMTDINQSNVRVKDVLETQIVNHNDSIGKIYNITSQLDRYMPEEVLFHAAEVVSQLMNSRDVAIYTVSNRDYARLVSATSKEARQYGHSIRYQEMDEMSQALNARRVYINRSIDEHYPHMANAIYEGDEMQLILMVWGIQWEQMTLGQANLLVVVSYLIQNAVLHANRYMSALEDKRYVDGNNIMETEAFVTLVKAFYRARDRELTECTLLRILTEASDFKEAGEILHKKLRQSDYLGTLRDGNLYALLANTDLNAAEIVVSRFREIGYETQIVEEIQV